MNISFNWLRDLIAIDLTPEEVAGQFTRVGLAVEGIHPHGEDFVLDVDLTSNRPDCLSHLGMARELAAITGQPMIGSAAPADPAEEIPYPLVLAPDVVKIEDPNLCPRFTVRTIKNVKIGPSPEWLVKRLEAIGERSINNVADITNYVMHELGQPMHAFDLDKISGNRIVVRRAAAGETITTLDEIERKLDESMLAICDAERPVAVAGIMGGLNSSITEDTNSVLLEVAYFKRENIRQTSRKLNLATEASYRFERGADIENLKRASDRAANLIAELADGELGEIVDVYPTKHIPIEIESRNLPGAVKRLSGIDAETDRCLEILDALGVRSRELAEDDSGQMAFVPPTWRHDLSIEEDLVEEIVRHTGYENIAEELPPAYGAGEYQADETRKRLLRQSLTSLGFSEALAYSFIDMRFDGMFETIPGLVQSGLSEPFVTLRDSVIESAVRMRTTLLPGLVESARLNFNHQRRDIQLFEIGKVFASNSNDGGLPTECELLALIITGSEISEGRGMALRPLDFYDIKGAVEAALTAIGITRFGFAAEDVIHLRRGQSAAVSVNGRKIGTVGRLSEEITAHYKFRQAVYVAEIDLQAALAAETQPVVYQALPKYPSVVRDVSFLVKRTMTFADIRAAIESQEAELCRSIGFVDVYEGKGLEADERSLTIRIEYRSDEKTLVESDVDALHHSIIQNLETTLGIRPRF